MVADEKKQKGGILPPFYTVPIRLFIQVCADGDVTATFLPLAGNVVVLRPFLRRALGGLVRNLGHVAVIAGELDAVKRRHLGRGNLVHFFDFGAIRQRDGVTSTF